MLTSKLLQPEPPAPEPEKEEEKKEEVKEEAKEEAKDEADAEKKEEEVKEKEEKKEEKEKVNMMTKLSQAFSKLKPSSSSSSKPAETDHLLHKVYVYLDDFGLQFGHNYLSIFGYIWI